MAKSGMSLGAVVAEEQLHELRDEHRGSVEREAEHEHEEEGDGEGLALEEREVQDRPVADANLPQLPDDERDERGSAGEDEEGDDVRAEPIVFLALVEDELERTEADGQKGEAEVVEVKAALFGDGDLFIDPGWIFDEARGEEEREQSDGDVDEEDPAPVVVVGDPATERGADGGRGDEGEAVERNGLAALGGGEGVGEDGLFGGRESAAAGALQDAEEDE